MHRSARAATPSATGAPLCDIGDDAPFALVVPARGGIRIMAVNKAGKRAGVRLDQLLADARALCPALKVYDTDPLADDKAVERLAQWCMRYTPWVAPAKPHDIVLDITGCAHLVGGEAALAETLRARFQAFGFTAQIGIAETIGAAWAVSHFCRPPVTIVGPDEASALLAPLPVAALRVDAATSERLARVGLKTIGDVIGKPRAPLAARYGAALLERLDQALRRASECLSPMAECPRYRCHVSFAEPILTVEQIAFSLQDLAASMAALLGQAGFGARRFALSCYCMDGRVLSVAVRTSSLCCHAARITRLFQEKLAALPGVPDTGAGIEHMALNAFDAEILTDVQAPLSHETQAAGGDLSVLLERYGNRLGFDAVQRFAPYHSHVPECSEQLVPVDQPPDATWPAFVRQLQHGRYLGRPVFLLPRPEPVTALAQVPDGPPVRFEWRRMAHRVAKAEGPERIAPEWWGQPSDRIPPTRDYFRIESVEGHRFWLYRSGLYDRPEPPTWFLHGFFA